MRYFAILQLCIFAAQGVAKLWAVKVRGWKNAHQPVLPLILTACRFIAAQMLNITFKSPH